MRQLYSQDTMEVFCSSTRSSLSSKSSPLIAKYAMVTLCVSKDDNELGRTAKVLWKNLACRPWVKVRSVGFILNNSSVS